MSGILVRLGSLESLEGGASWMLFANCVKLCGLITDILVLSRRIFMDPLDLPESLSFVERCRNLPDL